MTTLVADSVLEATLAVAVRTVDAAIGVWLGRDRVRAVNGTTVVPPAQARRET
jgi:hypothetical protein